MSDTLASFFELRAGVTDAGVGALFDHLKGTKHSIEVYEKLFGLSIEVLKQRSLAFRRAEHIETTPAAPAIPRALEKLVLASLDEELFVEDEYLTLFEGCSFAAVTPPHGQPRVYFEFKIGDVGKAFTAVQVYFKRIDVNERIESFNKQYKPGTGQGFPAPVATNDNGAVNKTIRELITWIKAHVPLVRAALGLKTTEMTINFVFAPRSPLARSSRAGQNRIDAIQTFCRQFELRPQGQRSRANIRAREAFIDALKKSMLKDSTPPQPWSHPQQLSECYQRLREYAYSGEARIGRYSKDRATIGALSELWTAGLALVPYPGEPPMGARRRSLDVSRDIHRVLSGYRPAEGDSLFHKTLTEHILPKLRRSLERELGIERLEQLEQEGKETPPKVLPFDKIELLKLGVDEILASLLLTYRGAFKPKLGGGKQGCKAGLLPLDDDWTLVKGKDVAGRIVGAPREVEQNGGPTVPVDGDPAEDGKPAYRPICFYDEQKHFVFGNIWPPATDAGTFFFQDLDDPTLVLTRVAHTVEVGGTKYTENRPLTIDFETCGINGARTTHDGTSFCSRGLRGGIRKLYFFKTLNEISPWGDFRSSLTFLPYYRTVAGKPAQPEGRVRREMPAGRGTGIGRADRVAESHVLWQWDAPAGDRDRYPDLPKLLELPPERQIVRQDGGGDDFTARIGGKPYQCQRSTKPFTDSGFWYSLLTITPVQGGAPSDTKYYVQANTPRPPLGGTMAVDGQPPAKSHVADATRTVLRLFDFRYYRRVHGGLFKVLKDVPEGSTRRPGVGDGPEVEKKGGATLLGINLPVSFHLDANVEHLARTKGERLDVKNKASVLYKAVGAREDAGGVMKEIYPAMVAKFRTGLKKTVASESTLPATAFAAAGIQEAPTPREDWQELKGTDWTELTVNQEWCHLQGHGDGGTERLGNFVCGSFHCNTEQLAMEEGLRETTHRAEKGSYLLRTTAYLLDDRAEVMLKDYLEGDSVYHQLLAENKKIVDQQRGSSPQQGQGAVRAAQAPPGQRNRAHTPPRDAKDPPGHRARESGPTRLPVAAFIRYKIIQKEGTTYKKVWDHIFEGESEFFDRWMYLILSQATRFSLAGMAAFETWYANASAAIAQTSAGRTMDKD